MADPTEIQRGHAHKATVVAVAERHWSDPIPDEFLALFEAAGLVIDDNDHTVIAYRHGRKIGAVWGPAVEGHWFAYRSDTPCATFPDHGQQARRVADRDEGLRHLLDTEQAAT